MGREPSTNQNHIRADDGRSEMYRTRLQIAVTVVSFSLGLLLILIARSLVDAVSPIWFPYDYDGDDSQRLLLFTYVLAFALLGVAIFSAVLLYLRGVLFPPDQSKSVVPTTTPSSADNDDKIEALSDGSQDEPLGETQGELDSSEDTVQASQGIAAPSKKTEAIGLSRDALAKIERELSENALKAIESKYARDLHKNTRLVELKSTTGPTKERLSREIESLLRRNNINLAIGVSTTFLAVSLLAYMVLREPVELSSTTSLMSHYIPRLSLVIFVEVFAFFFLRLYRAGLEQIRYFQNELTNVEMKYVALEAAVLKESDALDPTLLQLAQTERNFVLQNGQTTVDLEKARVENQQATEALNAITSALTSLRAPPKP
jgi:hypothetical protein